MELNRIEEQLNAVQDLIEDTDPLSDDYAVLLKRQDDLRKVILDEEKRRAKESLEREKNERDLNIREFEVKDRWKDRLIKIGTVVGTIGVGLVSVYADEFRSECKAGLDKVERLTKIRF